MLYTNQQAPKKTDIDHASQMFLTNQRSIDAPSADPAVSTSVINDPPKTSPVKRQKRRSTDSTHDHLQRCMDSVQELANTIACAMSAWQGHEKNGSSDIHGSHAKLIADISELPTDLECETCRGRVSWSHFDLVKAASECLGTCTCVNRISSSHWRCCNYDPADTYKDSEPRGRGTKLRRGSVDCGGAIRERSVSMIESYGADPRRSTRDVAFPPSQRGWDKIQDLGRSRSKRNPVPHSPSRNRDEDESRGRYTDSRDPYYIAPRKTSADRNRASLIHRELGLAPQDHSSDSDPDRERRRREREQRQAERQGRKANCHQGDAANYYEQNANSPPRPGSLRASCEDDASQAPSQGTWSSAPTNPDLRRRASILDTTMDPGLMAQVIDNSASEKRENRVRIVDPPSDEEDKKPKGILKRPTSKYPEDPNAVREGVAPLKDVCFSNIPIPPPLSLTSAPRRIKRTSRPAPAGLKSTAVSSTRKRSRNPTSASKSARTSSSSCASSPKRKSRNSPTVRATSEVSSITLLLKSPG